MNVRRFRSLIIAVVVSSALATALAFWPNGGGEAIATPDGKVFVCHVDSFGYGCRAAPKTLSIPVPALAVHPAHGDTEGACN